MRCEEEDGADWARWCARVETPAALGDIPFLPANHTHGRVIQAVVHRTFGCAAMEDGAAVCWGVAEAVACNRPHHLRTIRGVGRIVSCTYRFESDGVSVDVEGMTCALLRSVAVRCWGLPNTEGCLGYGHSNLMRDANDDVTRDIDLGEHMLAEMPFVR